MAISLSELSALTAQTQEDRPISLSELSALNQPTLTATPTAADFTSPDLDALISAKSESFNYGALKWGRSPGRFDNLINEVDPQPISDYTKTIADLSLTGEGRDIRRSRLDPNFTIGEELLGAGAALVEGFGGVVAGLVDFPLQLSKLIEAGVQSFGGGANKFTPTTPGEYEVDDIWEFNNVSRTALAERIIGFTARDPEEIIPGFFTSDLPTALGQVLGFMATGGVARLASLPLGYAMAYSGAAVGGFYGLDDAMAHGATESEALAAFTFDSLLGTTEAIPIMGIFNRLNKATGGQTSQFLRKAYEGIAGTTNLSQVLSSSVRGGKLKLIAREAAFGALEEAVQETFQSAGENIVASTDFLSGYDPTRSWNDNLVKAAETGGSVGFLMNMLATTIGIKRGRIRTPAEIEKTRALLLAAAVDRPELLLADPDGNLTEDQKESMVEQRKLDDQIIESLPSIEARISEEISTPEQETQFRLWFRDQIANLDGAGGMASVGQFSPSETSDRLGLNVSGLSAGELLQTSDTLVAGFDIYEEQLENMGFEVDEKVLVEHGLQEGERRVLERRLREADEKIAKINAKEEAQEVLLTPGERGSRTKAIKKANLLRAKRDRSPANQDNLRLQLGQISDDIQALREGGEVPPRFGSNFEGAEGADIEFFKKSAIAQLEKEKAKLQAKLNQSPVSQENLVKVVALQAQAKKAKDLKAGIEQILKEVQPLMINPDTGQKLKILVVPKVLSLARKGEAGVNSIEFEGHAPGSVAIIGMNLQRFEEGVADDILGPQPGAGRMSPSRAGKAGMLSTLRHELGHVQVFTQFRSLEQRVLELNKNNIKDSRDHRLYKALRLEHALWAWNLANANIGSAGVSTLATGPTLNEAGQNNYDISALSVPDYWLTPGFTFGQDSGDIPLNQAVDPRSIWARKSSFLTFHEFLAQSAAFQLDEKGKGGTNEYFAQAVKDLKKLHKTTEPFTKDSRQNVEQFIKSLSIRAKVSEARQAQAQNAPQTFVDALKGKIKGFDVDGGFESFNTDQDTFNTALGWGLNVLQMDRENQHLPDNTLPQFAESLRNMSNDRNNRLFAAEQTLNKIKGLGKENIGKLSAVLFEEVQNEKFARERDLKAKGWTEDMLSTRRRIHEDFSEILTEMENLALENAKVTFTDIIEQGREVKRLQDKFAELRKTPYFPAMRFGKWATQVLDENGNQVAVFAHEKESDRDRDVKKRRKEAAVNNTGEKIVKITFSDAAMSLQGLPRDFGKVYARKLAAKGMPLTTEQSDLLSELSYESSKSKFLKHFKKKKNVAGFSEDLMRAYSTYMALSATHIARATHIDSLVDSIDNLDANHRFIKRVAPVEISDLSKRDRIRDWMDSHLKYVMTPGVEWTSIRAGMFTLALGFNIKSALVNSTQLMFTSYPYLTARFGRTAVGVDDARAVTAIGNNITQLAKFWKKGTQFSEGKTAMFQQGKMDGWLEQGLAVELALAQRADRMDRMLPQQGARLFAQKIPGWSAVFFHAVEKSNRHITAGAAYDLALENGMSHEAAIVEARDAVDRTQFEHNRWNRPKLFQGRKGALFVFQNYTQNILYFALREQGAKRYWMMQLALAGILGLPGADDLLDLMSVSWTQIRKGMGTKAPFVDFQQEMIEAMGQVAQDINVNPDMFLWGISRSSFGLANLQIFDRFPIPRIDLSGSLSMGDILPVTENLRTLQTEGLMGRFAERATESVGGAAGAQLFSMLRALDGNDPDQWRRWERMMPAAARQASRAARLWTRGAEVTRRGDKIAEFDMTDSRDRADLAATALGFQPTVLSEGWEKLFAKREVTMYYRTWKSDLLTDWNWARNSKDREGRSDAMRAIKMYNNQVPFGEMKISTKTLKRSADSFDRTQRKSGTGVALQSEYIRLQRSIEQSFANAGVFEDPRSEDISSSEEPVRGPSSLSSSR